LHAWQLFKNQCNFGPVVYLSFSCTFHICTQSQAVAVYHWLWAHDLLFAAFFLFVTHMHLNRMRQKHPWS